jgi:hypothetical protein
VPKPEVADTSHAKEKSRPEASLLDYAAIHGGFDRLMRPQRLKDDGFPFCS